MQYWSIEPQVFFDAFKEVQSEVIEYRELTPCEMNAPKQRNLDDMVYIYLNASPFFGLFSVHKNKNHLYFIEVTPGKYMKCRPGEFIPPDKFYRLRMATDRYYYTENQTFDLRKIEEVSIDEFNWLYSIQHWGRWTDSGKVVAINYKEFQVIACDVRGKFLKQVIPAVDLNNCWYNFLDLLDSIKQVKQINASH